MTELDRDLAAFAGLWQAEEEPALDWARLARRARWVGWRMRLLYAFEVIVGAFGVGLYLGFSFMDGGLALMVLGVAMTVYMLTYLFQGWRVRAGAWGHGAEADRDLLALQIRRAESALGYVHLNVVFSYIGLLFVPLMLWYAVEQGVMWGEPRATRLAMLTGFLAAGMAAFVVGARIWAKSKRQELERLLKVQAQLTDEGPNGL